jgi:DNA/RNA endonuclease YhcR with UshA esterase domain
MLPSFSLLLFSTFCVVNGFFVQSTPSRNSPSSSTLIKASSVESVNKMAEEVKVGDTIPSLVLMEGTGNFEKQEVNIAELIAGKKVAIFGVPGAFTPGMYR